MIELPDSPAPNGVQAALMDFGMNLRPMTGAATARVERKGGRFRAVISYPPMVPDKAEVFVARLLRAKRQGLRIQFPLIRPQGSPGSPVVDGAGQTGSALAVRGLSPGYAVKEGFWLSIEGSDGQHYLHKAAGAVMADSLGEATLQIEPALRAPFADGAAVHLAVPMIEGFVVGEEWGWTIPLDKLIALEFTIEEAA